MIYLENLKKARKDRGLRQVDMSNLLGRGKTTIERWERGITEPTNSEIHIIARILKVDISFISDIPEIDFDTITTKRPIKITRSPVSFVKKIESSLSIQDRILLNGINTELQTLRNKVHKLEQESSPSELIADEINSFIYKKDINGRFSYINKYYLQYLDIDNSMILGRMNKEIFGWQKAEILDELEAKAMQGLTIHNMDMVIPGGMKKRHGLLSAFPVYKLNGTIQEIIFKIDDITDKLELIDKYKTLENVIHSSNEILWIKDDKGTYSFIGAPIYSISGYHVNEFLNNPIFWLSNVVNEYDRERVGTFYKTYESGDSIDYKIKTKDNNSRFVKEKIFHQDKLTFGIIQDVTNELEAQEDKQILLDVIDEMPVVIGVIKNFGQDHTCNPAMNKVYGTSAKTFNEMCHDVFTRLIHPDDRKRVMDYKDYLTSDKYWKDETKKSMHTGIKYRIISKNGKIKWIRAKTYSTPKFKKQGVRFGFIWDATKEHEVQLAMCKNCLKKKLSSPGLGCSGKE